MLKPNRPSFWMLWDLPRLWSLASLRPSSNTWKRTWTPKTTPLPHSQHCCCKHVVGCFRACEVSPIWTKVPKYTGLRGKYVHVNGMFYKLKRYQFTLRSNSLAQCELDCLGGCPHKQLSLLGTSPGMRVHWGQFNAVIYWHHSPISQHYRCRKRAPAKILCRNQRLHKHLIYLQITYIDWSVQQSKLLTASNTEHSHSSSPITP